MKLTALLATLAFALGPSIAAAACSGHTYETTCAAGQTYDETSRSCVTAPTG